MVRQSDCPKCLKWDVPTLVSFCGHTLCKSCIYNAFSVDSEVKCIKCDKILKKHDYTEQRFENLMVHRELVAREYVNKIYTKSRNHFITLREYNDYLEEVESLVFDLLNDIDPIGTKKKIDDYRLSNKVQIQTTAHYGDKLPGKKKNTTNNLGEAYEYQEFKWDNLGPPVPSFDILEKIQNKPLSQLKKNRKKVYEDCPSEKVCKAGGFLSARNMQRSLEEAYDSLYLQIPTTTQ